MAASLGSEDGVVIACVVLQKKACQASLLSNSSMGSERSKMAECQGSLVVMGSGQICEPAELLHSITESWEPAQAGGKSLAGGVPVTRSVLELQAVLND